MTNDELSDKNDEDLSRGNGVSVETAANITNDELSDKNSEDPHGINGASVEIGAKITNDSLSDKNGEDPTPSVERTENKCDLYSGTWVKDEEYPIYRPGSCPYVDEAFDCQSNGRRDADYLKWRWKPHTCDLPRLLFFFGFSVNVFVLSLVYRGYDNYFLAPVRYYKKVINCCNQLHCNFLSLLG